MPGPTLAACLGDVISVEVRSHLATESFTLHWHGTQSTVTHK